jgi:nucleotide-binding universal stress UspA family protein
VGVGFLDEYGIEVAQEYLYKEGLIPNVNPPLIERVRQDYDRVLEQYAGRCGEAGVSCTTPSQTSLSLDRVLFEAQRHDLIVMDRLRTLVPGFEGPQSQNLGRILKHSPRPIVMVPPHGAAGDRREVMVAYDGSLQSARALYSAAFSVLESDAKVHIVSVAAARAESARAADQAIAFLRLHQVDAIPHPIESHESPSGVILDQADRLGAGLIVMGAYGEPVLREFFLGSVSRNILEESRVPVFLAH